MVAADHDVGALNVCGIFGIVGPGGAEFTRGLEILFLLSESRGKEAAGLAINDGREITVLKEPLPASAMIRSAQYRGLMADKLLRQAGQQNVAAIGHSRLVTNGRGAIAANNQPIIKGRAVAVHNGIIVNDQKIWRAHPELQREADVDTEAFLALFERFRQDGTDDRSAFARAFAAIEGTASMALLLGDRHQLMVGTNNGSLYVCRLDGRGFYFASERYILDKAIERMGQADGAVIDAVASGSGRMVDIRSLAVESFAFGAHVPAAATSAGANVALKISDLSRRKDPRYANLRRCTQCILPETMPFIAFDRDGVCNYCRTYVPYKPHGLDALRELVAPYRSRTGAPDCLVAVSGGRDSCYGLHVLSGSSDSIRRLYLRLGRHHRPAAQPGAPVRQARHRAHPGFGRYSRKREYVRRNVEAWLSGRRSE